MRSRRHACQFTLLPNPSMPADVLAISMARQGQRLGKRQLHLLLYISHMLALYVDNLLGMQDAAGIADASVAKSDDSHGSSLTELREPSNSSSSDIESTSADKS